MQERARGWAIGIAVVLGALVCAVASLLPKRVEPREIRALALSPASAWVAAGGSSGRVRLWQVGNKTQAHDLALASGNLNDLQFTHDGRFLAVASQNLTLYDLRRGQSRVLRDDKANYGVARFSSDDRTLLTLSGLGEIILLDLASGASHAIYCCTSIWGEVAFLNNDQQIAWAGHWPGILDRHSGSVLGRFTNDRQFETFGPIAIDRGAIFIGSQDGRVYSWDIQTRRLLGKSPALSGYVRAVTTLGQTGWVAYTASDGGSIHIWQPESGTSRMITSARPTSNLVYKQDNIVFGTSSGEVQVWDLLGNQQIK